MPRPPEEPWHRAGLANLKADLDDQGINLSELSHRSGVGYEMVRQMRNGIAVGSVTSQRRVAEAMGRLPGYYFPRSAAELECSVRCEADKATAQ